MEPTARADALAPRLIRRRYAALSGTEMQVAVWGGVLVMGLSVSVGGQGPPPPRRLPPPGRTATASATQPVSSVVVVTWVTRYGHDGLHTLELLVVWRGQPGWFTRVGPRTSSGGGSGSSFHSTSQFGDVELQLALDSSAHTAKIQGQSIDLGESNVVLVDGVGSADRVRVVAKLRVDPDVVLLYDGRPDIDAVLMRSADVVSFLQCEVQTPGGRGSARWPTCARVLGK